MDRTYFVQLFEYTDWANRQVWDCVMKASDEDYFKDQTFSVGSIYTQLFHWMYVEKWWIGFLATGEAIFPTEDLYETYKDRAKLRQLWDKIHSENMAYLQNLTPEECQRKVKPPHWNDEDPPITVAQALTQVANHSTDHRAQTMAVLHTMGYDGVGQDFLSYLHRDVNQEG